MAYIPGLGYIGGPQDLLQNEWVIFGGIFLLTFAIVYISISKIFSSTKKASFEDLLRGKSDKIIAHPAAVVVALVIAFFTSAAVVQEDLVRQYFGNVLTVWVGVFVFIVLVILTIPFWKALKHSLGDGKSATVIANLFVVGCFWASLKFLLPAESLYYVSYNMQEAYSWLISVGGLIVLTIIGTIFGLIFGKK